MAESQQTKNSNQTGNGRGQKLTDSPMMAHLLAALEDGTDIGHYGRLVFTMVARHFMAEDEVVTLLANQPDVEKKEARALWLQVEERNYNPPHRDKILAWQAEQEFPICPNPEDPNGCNVYRELNFPDGIYDDVEAFWEERAGA